MALSLLRLTDFQLIEIKRGMSGLGNYVLRDGIEVIPWVSESTAVTPPEDIVDRIRESGILGSRTTDETDVSQPSTSHVLTPSTPSHDIEEHNPVETQPQSANPEVNNASVNERAVHVINSKNIELNPQLAVFTVQGTVEPRVVRLFPSISCSCPAKSQCYHITAAKLAIGMKDAAPRRQINLTQLRKNKRKKIDKTSGRKRPRTDDVDVIPAGDIDQDELQDLMDEVIQSSNPEPASQQEPEQESADDEVINMDICHKCRKVTPPETKNKIINWIGCDRCPRWFHKFCVGIRANKKLEHYICNMC